MNFCIVLKNMGSKLICVCWYEVFVNMMMIIFIVMYYYFIIVMIMIIVIIVMIIISNGIFVVM